MTHWLSRWFPSLRDTRDGRRLLLARGFVWTPTHVAPVYDDFVAGMERHYSLFLFKPTVRWTALAAQHREAAVSARDEATFVAVLLRLLTPLRDLHVQIVTPRRTVPTHVSPAQYNGNLPRVRRQLVQPVICGAFARVGRTRPDGFGYFLLEREPGASGAEVAQAVTAIRELRSVPGMIVDLRLANGGDEDVARTIATEFCATPTAYAEHKVRSGPLPHELSPAIPRILPAADQPYLRPVVCLTGPGTVSSGESFVAMLRSLPQVTTLGLPTRGSSGNPQLWELGPTGLAVRFSRWVDFLPGGRLIEGLGIPPQVEVRELHATYQNQDPTLSAALALLRTQTGMSSVPTLRE